MKEIVILSGKGGVGKSSLTAALGTLLGRRHSLVLADTDVDAPNLHLVLGAERLESSPITASEKAFVDMDRCVGCGLCTDVCRFDAIIGDSRPVIARYSCEGCGACAIACPEEAITIRQVTNGRLDIMAAGDHRVVSGSLDIGASSSGRLVDVVKRRARELAGELGAGLILTDGPPGIGCPVIATLKGADHVVLVTEPTPSALSDLGRVVEVVQGFHLPLGVVLNRADIFADGRGQVLRYLDAHRIELLAEIPYDPELPRALARGELAVTARPDAPSSLAIRGLGKRIDDLIRRNGPGRAISLKTMT